MVFTLEALQAKFGDALLLHYGPTDSPSLIVIDAGPPGVYKASVRPRLMEIRDSVNTDQPLPIRLLMVSHIDGDHISGVLALTKEMIDKEEASQPQPYRITTLWHNSFDDILGNKAETLSSVLSSSVGAVTTGGAIPDDLPVSFESALIVATVPQGRDLRNNAAKLAMLVNSPFPELVMAPQTGSSVVDIGDDLKLTIIAPNQQRLKDLQAEWDAKLKAAGLGKVAESEAAAFLDKSIANLSSIVVLAETGGKRMLLTGDARGDDILSGLKTAGLLQQGKLHVDLLKLPHHGSDRNVSTNFFRKITADHYVISADGTNDNPDIPTLLMISTARGQSKFTIHLTNREERLEEFFSGEKEKGKKYNVVFRELDAHSVKIDLADPLQI